MATATKKKGKPSNPVIEAAQEQKEDIITLRSGVRIKLIPVPASLIDAVTSKIKDPEIPKWVDDEGRETYNPLDPQYEKDLADANRRRGLAAIDAMALFGVELVDGLPPDEEWLTKLQYMEKFGLIDVLKDYDLNDPITKELVYKKYVGVTTDVIAEVTEISGISPEEVLEAEESFPDQ